MCANKQNNTKTHQETLRECINELPNEPISILRPTKQCVPIIVQLICIDFFLQIN